MCLPNKFIQRCRKLLKDRGGGQNFARYIHKYIYIYTYIYISSLSSLSYLFYIIFVPLQRIFKIIVLILRPFCPFNRGWTGYGLPNYPTHFTSLFYPLQKGGWTPNEFLNHHTCFISIFSPLQGFGQSMSFQIIILVLCIFLPLYRWLDSLWVSRSSYSFYAFFCPSTGDWTAYEFPNHRTRFTSFLYPIQGVGQPMSFQNLQKV